MDNREKFIWAVFVVILVIIIYNKVIPPRVKTKSTSSNSVTQSQQTLSLAIQGMTNGLKDYNINGNIADVQKNENIIADIFENYKSVDAKNEFYVFVDLITQEIDMIKRKASDTDINTVKNSINMSADKLSGLLAIDPINFQNYVVIIDSIIAGKDVSTDIIGVSNNISVLIIK